MRTATPGLDESEFDENCDDFGWFEDRDDAHGLRNSDVLNTNEFRFQARLAVLKQHRNDFL